MDQRKLGYLHGRRRMRLGRYTDLQHNGNSNLFFYLRMGRVQRAYLLRFYKAGSKPKLR